jgi:hypothetical protein
MNALSDLQLRVSQVMAEREKKEAAADAKKPPAADESVVPEPTSPEPAATASEEQVDRSPETVPVPSRWWQKCKTAVRSLVDFVLKK